MSRFACNAHYENLLLPIRQSDTSYWLTAFRDESLGYLVRQSHGSLRPLTSPWPDLQCLRCQGTHPVQYGSSDSQPVCPDRGMEQSQRYGTGTTDFVLEKYICQKGPLAQKAQFVAGRWTCSGTSKTLTYHRSKTQWSLV